MQIKKIGKKIETYQVSKNFYVDVEEKIEFGEEWLGLWLYHNQYGVKEYMMGIKKSDIGPGETWETIEEYIQQIIVDEVRMYYEDYIIDNDILQELNNDF